MDFKVYKVVSSESGFVGHEILLFGEYYMILADQSFLKGLRIGRITPNLTEKLEYVLVYDAEEHKAT